MDYQVLICFEDELLEPFQNMMNSILEMGKIPESWEEANIELIPKKGQDSVLTSNCRLIQILDNDYNLFTMILADRLKIIL